MANKLNLGCGPKWKKQYPDYIGLDINDYGQRFFGNIFDIFPSLYKENFWDEVMANHFLEHFSQRQLKVIFKKVWTILKPGGFFRFVVPHSRKERAWILTHKTFWNETTVRWLGEEEVDKVYGFGKWDIVDVVVNERDDIHALLRKK